MLSTEKWDNWEKPSLLFPFTALTWEQNLIFAQNVFKLVAQSVDKYGAVRSFINDGIMPVMIVT